MHVVGHFLFGQVRELRAVLGPDRVDRALIGLEVQELAGCADIHPLPFLVLVQPLFLKLADRHVEMPGYALQVPERIGRRHRPATIGTGQAIGFLPDLLVDSGCIGIKLPGRIVLHPGEKTPEPRAVLNDTRRKLSS